MSETVALAPGLTVPRVLHGLWQVADQERAGTTLDPAAAAAALDPLVDAGFDAFDVADHYGTAERIAGTLRRRRPAVRVLTKWVPEPGVRSRAAVRAAVERSLRRIGTDRLDLLQFHAWSYPDPAWLDCLAHLAELREEGLIRELGVTNFDAVHLDIALRSGFPIVSNQVAASLLDWRAAGAMREVCRTHGVRLLAYGTLAGGFLSRRWVGAPAPPMDEAQTWSRMKYRRFIEAAGGWDRFQPVLGACRRIAHRIGVSVANVACRAVLERPEVAAVIVGVRPGGRSYLHDNRRLLSFSLDERSRQELEAAAAGLDPIPGDCGDEYRRPPYLTASGDLHHHVSEFPDPFPVRRTEDGGRRVDFGAAGRRPSRAVRSGERIRMTGVTARHRGRVVGGDSAAAQTRFLLDRIEGGLQSLGSAPEELVRVRLRHRRPADGVTAARIVRERLPHLPAECLEVVGDLPEDSSRVRIEADAEAVVSGQ